MTSEIVKVGTGEIVSVDNSAMSIESIVAQVALIQNVMKAVMKENEHYGKIPGCGDKPTLLKAGAEKLAMTFRLAPEYEVGIVDWQNGHREYQVKCRLRHIPSGNIVGEGHGTCSTMEGKFRFRAENTGRPVPKEYWDTRNSDILGGPTFKARKVGKDWFIFQEVEHPNPADYYNTCEKMGLKRAFVCGLLSSTACSDLFTQDIEDMPEVFAGANKPAASAPKLSDDQITMFWTAMSKAGLSADQVHTSLKSIYGYNSVKDIPADALDEVMAKVSAAVPVIPQEGEAPSDPSVPLVPFGDSKGKPITDLPDKDLASMIKYYRGEGTKQPNPKYKESNDRLLAALEAERDTRLRLS
jgi:hypothetical protein